MQIVQVVVHFQPLEHRCYSTFVQGLKYLRRQIIVLLLLDVVANLLNGQITVYFLDNVLVVVLRGQQNVDVIVVEGRHESVQLGPLEVAVEEDGELVSLVNMEPVNERVVVLELAQQSVLEKQVGCVHNHHVRVTLQYLLQIFF